MGICVLFFEVLQVPRSLSRGIYESKDDSLGSFNTDIHRQLMLPAELSNYISIHRQTKD